MKKFLPFLIAIAVLILGAIFWFSRNRSAPPSTQKSTSTEPVNTIDVKDRPYVTLVPTVAGKHPPGREVTLTLSSNALNSKTVDYELEYQAGTSIQAAIGTIDLTKDQPPTTKDLLLGSCSAGGKCAYHDNVTGGSLTLRFQGGTTPKFNLKGEWNLQTMADRDGQFSSRDAKFQLDVGKSGLPASAIVIIAQTMGLPQPVTGEILAGPYGIFTNGQKLKGPAELTLRLTQPSSTVKLLGWDGKAWKEYKSSVSDKTLTATIDKLTTFIAISSQ